MSRRRSARRIPTAIRLRRHAPTWAAILIAAALIAAGYFGGGRSEAPTVDIGDSGRTYVVARVIDGDTLLLVGGERVRLLGIDTPESVAPGRPVEPLGREASAFTERLAEGKAVRLGFDKERTDRYGRLLAYVYVGEVLLNEEIIRAGLSEAQPQHPYSGVMKRRFRDAEQEARERRRGLWALRSGDSPASRSPASTRP